MNDGSIDKEKEECKKLKWNKLWMKKNVTVGKSRTEACLHIRFNITKDWGGMSKALIPVVRNDNVNK